jgi:hypothetical protein
VAGLIHQLSVLGCNTILAQGFKIQNPTTGQYVTAAAMGNVVADGITASRIVQSTTPSLFTISASTFFFGLFMLNS